MASASEHQRRRWTSLNTHQTVLGQIWFEGVPHIGLMPASHCVGTHTDALHLDDSDGNDIEDLNDDDGQTLTTSEGARAATSSTKIPHRWLQPSGAVSQPTTDCCEVCMNAPPSVIALVQCGHARFRSSCADTLTALAWQAVWWYFKFMTLKYLAVVLFCY